MKTKLFATAIIVLFTSAVFAQNDFSLAPYAGYTMSLFEDQEKADGAPLIGFRLGYELLPRLEVGAEFNYAIGGYKFEIEDEEMLTYTQTFEQMMLGIYGKFHIDAGLLKPYAKAGAGYYTGDLTVEEGGDEISLECDSGIGFCFGGGIIHKSGIFAEFNYNIVSRKIIYDDLKMNTWAVIIGCKFLK